MTDPDRPAHGEDFEVCRVGTLAEIKRLRERAAELEAERAEIEVTPKGTP